MDPTRIDRSTPVTRTPAQGFPRLDLDAGLVGLSPLRTGLRFLLNAGYDRDRALDAAQEILDRLVADRTPEAALLAPQQSADPIPFPGAFPPHIRRARALAAELFGEEMVDQVIHHAASCGFVHYPRGER